MKYKCQICGYIYDEANEGVPFAQLPDDWKCPLCGAPKSAFDPVEEEMPAAAQPIPSPSEEIKTDLPAESEQPLSIGQMAALCSNLSRGCEKQYMPDEAALFSQLADWFSSHAPKVEDATVQAISAQLQQNLSAYPAANKTCQSEGDRGAQRVLGWSEKATRMLSSILSRYDKEGDALLAGTEIWVCTVCGFVSIGQSAPDLCPICKVPSWKFTKIERRKQS